MSEKKPQFRKNKQIQQGVTLLELLVVVAILAAVAFIGGAAFDNAYDDTHEKLARSEMVDIVKAIKQFKQDTGYYPGEGPFAWLEDANTNGTLTCADDEAASSGGIDPSKYTSENHFSTPANFDQLFQEPEVCGNHPLSSLTSWNVDTGRGWRGPYLTNNLEFVDVGDNLQTNGTGLPSVVTSSALNSIRGVADTFEHRPVGTVLDWRVGLDASTHAHESHGRPYLYFIDPNAVANIEGCEAAPCLVSMGPNGEYQRNGSGDDIVMNIR